MSEQVCTRVLCKRYINYYLEYRNYFTVNFWEIPLRSLQVIKSSLVTLKNGLKFDFIWKLFESFQGF